MALGGYDGSIRIDTSLDAKNFNTGIKKITGSLKNLAGAVGIAFGIGALVKFGKEALNIASDLQEVENVVNVSFGNMKEMVEDFADTALEKFGMTELQAKKTASTYMAMNKGMGLNGEKAAQMAIDAAARTGDIASFFNKTQEEADTMMKSIWTGETESLKQIGVVMTENNLNMFAMQKGLGKTTQQMTQQEQVMLRYQYVMEQTSLAAGDFERTSDSWANQTRVLTGRWKEFLGIMGTGLIQMLTPAVKFLNSLMDSLIKFANIFSEVTAKIFGKQELSQGAGSASGAISDAASSANDYAEAADKAKKANEGFLTGLDNITKMSDSSASSSAALPPSQNVGGGINSGSGTVGEDIQISPNLQKILDIFDKLSSVNLNPAKNALDDLRAALEPFNTAVGAGLEWFMNNILVPLSKWVVEDAVPAFLNLLSGAIVFLTSVITIGKADIQWLWDNFLQPIAQWTGGIIVSVLNTLSEVLTKIGNWMLEHQSIVNGITIAIIAFFAAWDLVLLMSTIQQLGGMGIAFGKLVDAINLATLAKIKDKAETIALNLLYAKDFVVSIASSTTALIKQAAQWAATTVVKVADTAATWASQAATVAATAATWLFNTALAVLTSPITLVIAAIGALIGIIILCVKHWDEIKAAASKAWEWIKETWNKAADWFNETVVLPIQKFFSGLWEGIKNSFITAFNFIKDALKGYVNGWIFILESFINFFIKGINSLLGMLNKINITAPDWLPIVGGKTFGFNIKSIPTISIPRLATGAVIPPNAEFAAILGDQKKGRNLEAPEGLIRQIVKEESGSGDITIIVQMPDGEEKEVFSTKKINKKNRISGKIIVPVGV